MPTTQVNPYLDGNFAPQDREITSDTLTVIGELPPELSGMFLRNGPNPQFSPTGQYHWFDGDGMIHGVRIHNGQAQYQNRYVRTRGWQIEHEAGRAIWSGILEPPQMDNPYGPTKNTANTALVWHASTMLATWEGGAPYAIDLPTLDTFSEYTYDGKLTSSFTAHPKIDPMTGEMMFFGYSFAPPYLQYGVVSSTGELLKIVPIELPMAVMMHDFAITENYTIFMDLPLTFSPPRMQRGEPLLMFESNRPSRFGILPRHGDNSNIRWFEAPACYVFHTLNAYERGDEVVLVACRMDSTNVLMSQDSASSPEGSIPKLHQWRFNLKTGTISETMLDDAATDFPRVNENFLGRETQYGYAGRMARGSMPLFDGIVKYNLKSNKSQIHEFKSECYGGEAVFAPHPNAQNEDEGWLITFVYNSKEDTSELVIIDATDLTEPVARVLIPQRVPYGFHGTWISNSQLNAKNRN